MFFLKTLFSFKQGLNKYKHMRVSMYEFLHAPKYTKHGHTIIRYLRVYCVIIAVLVCIVVEHEWLCIFTKHAAHAAMYLNFTHSQTDKD